MKTCGIHIQRNGIFDYSMREEIYNIKGDSFNKADLLDYSKWQLSREIEEWRKEIFETILMWLEKDTIEFQSSGSTGMPKKIFHSKESINESALLTANFFGLNQKSKLLLCLPARYVAGKMMIFRAFCMGCQLDFVEPNSTPIIDGNYDFASFVPLQIRSLLKSEDSSLKQIRKILIGGASFKPDMIDELLSINPQAYESYGMTETLTHIALRKIGEKHFKALPGIQLDDEEGCLRIKAPHLGDEWIETNDIVDLNGIAEFELLGRKDRVINSGGIKIHPLLLEQKLADLISRPFYIAKKPDPDLGERVCLFVEGEEENIELKRFESVLEKYEMPKEIVFVPELKRTFSGKIIP